MPLASPSPGRPPVPSTATLLTRLCDTISRHHHLATAALLVVYLLATFTASHAYPLSHDEIFTLYLADAPTLRTMFREIRTVDLNPPLSYLLARCSLRLFGPSTLAVRLPEIVAFGLALLALAAFVRRRAGLLFGLLAATILFSGLAGELAANARPYALLLAGSCLGLRAWQLARSDGAAPRTRTLALALLAIAALILLLSHIFGLLAWAALLTGDLARLLHGRRRAHRVQPDLPALAAWTLPLLATATYIPLLRSHAISAFPPAFQPSGDDVFTFYIGHIDRELVGVALSALLIALLLGTRALRGRFTPKLPLDPTRPWLFTAPEWTTLIALLLTPAILIAWLALTHGAFFPRYGIVATIGVAALATAGLSCWTNHDPRAALLAILVFLLISSQLPAAVKGLRFLRSPLHLARATEPSNSPCVACRLAATLDPTLPLVDASGLTFLEMNQREPAATLDHVFYLTDPPAAMQYAHATIFEGMATEANIFHLRGRVTPYLSFLATHPRFLVFGDYSYPEDWLLRKLRTDGAHLELLTRVPGNDTDPATYKDHELYLVTLPIQ